MIFTEVIVRSLRGENLMPLTFPAVGNPMMVPCESTLTSTS